MTDVWARGSAYERFMGRWSRLVAEQFVTWLALPPGLRWADLGCGSGALTSVVLARTSPALVLGVDPSEAQVTEARRQVVDDRVQFARGGADSLEPGRFDVVVSGLVLNFVEDPVIAVARSAAAAPAGTVAAYVWDYSEGMQMLRTFWDVACALDPSASDLNEGRRFALATVDSLAEVWKRAGLTEVETTDLTVATVFQQFDDYWTPFLGGQGPAPAYVVSLGEDQRAELRDALSAQFHRERDGSIRLTARAWAVRGRAV